MYKNIFTLSACQREELLSCYAANVGIEIDQRLIEEIAHIAFDIIYYIILRKDISYVLGKYKFDFQEFKPNQKGLLAKFYDNLKLNKDITLKDPLYVVFRIDNFDKLSAAGGFVGENNGSVHHNEINVSIPSINFWQNDYIKNPNKILGLINHELAHVADYFYQGYPKLERGYLSMEDKNLSNEQRLEIFRNYVNDPFEVRARTTEFNRFLNNKIKSENIKDLREIQWNTDLLLEAFKITDNFPGGKIINPILYYTDDSKRYTLQKGYEYARRLLEKD